MKKTQTQDEFIRKRIERQRKIRKRRLILGFWFFMILLACVGTVLSFTVFFPIEKITATGSSIYTEEQILNASGIEKGDNLLSISEKATLKKLKKTLPYIETLDFDKKLPSTLKLKVSDAEEFTSYCKKDMYYTVSESGWVLNKSSIPPENIYTVLGVDFSGKVGTEIVFNDIDQKNLINEISKNLNENEIKINYIDITDTITILIGVENRFTVNLGTSNFITEKIRHLSGMIEKIPEESKGNINLSMWTTDNTQGTFKAENAQ